MAKNFKIEGMDCHACSLVIKMSLEDAGFEEIEVNQETEELIIPEKNLQNLKEIKEVVDGAGHYKLIV